MVIVSREKTKLVDSKISDYLDGLKSGEGTPGGGAVNALAGAQAAALLMKVCAVTAENEDFSEFASLNKTVVNSLEPIFKDFQAEIDRDTEAYNVFTSAKDMPSETPVEKSARNEAMARAAVEATDSPVHIMDLALKTLIVAATVKKKFDPELAGDYGAAALNLRSAVYGAWMDVRANIDALHDAELRNHYESHGFEVVRKAAKLSEELFISANKMI